MCGDVIISKVDGRKDLRRFIAFPNQLFKDVPTYIPAMNFDEKGLLGSKNPSLKHSQRELFLAWRDGKVVGRVAAIINHTVNEVWNKKTVRFGWFDFIEDYDVFSALINKVIEYGKANGMSEIEGPMGFTDMDKECWVIDNFNGPQNISTLYNPEYYVRFVERMGMEIKCKWQQYIMPANQPIPDKVKRLNSLIAERYGLKVLKVHNHRELKPYGYKMFHTINSSFKDLYDFVPMTQEELDVYVKEYIPFVPLRYANFVVDKDDNLVAFGLAIPSLSKAYQKAKGRLFPFGWYYILRALRKYDSIDLLLNGVLPEWQKRGVHAIYYCEMNKNAIEDNVHTAFTNPQIIGNEAVKIWSTQFMADPVMQRAVFGMNI
ncbi:MAG: hypothetical protein KBT04_03755 [Bacteroidales bacterium]|nr:hypothetical protein [Candidatus Colimorpha onthohippi]